MALFVLSGMCYTEVLENCLCSVCRFCGYVFFSALPEEAYFSLL